MRIALQCSESDAHLILSEENAAARLLTRPGEAIYNDSNGLLEGNHPFQIAWLPDDRRDDYPVAGEEITMRQGVMAHPAIVFEGNVASDPQNNADIVKTIESFAATSRPRRMGAARSHCRYGLGNRSRSVRQRRFSSIAVPGTTC